MISTDAIFYYIQTMVATMLGRISVTWEEVEEVYTSGKYPEINTNIDYIIFCEIPKKGLTNKT